MFCENLYFPLSYDNCAIALKKVKFAECGRFGGIFGRGKGMLWLTERTEVTEKEFIFPFH